MEEFEIFEFTYVIENKKSSLEFAIYARKEETAFKIISYWNEFTRFKWIPRNKKFKEKIFIDKPPYEIEQEQIRYSKKMRKIRKERLEKGLFKI